MARASAANSGGSAIVLDEMCSLLQAAAQDINWEQKDAPQLVSKMFRGAFEEVEAKLPNPVRGLMIGRYPVIVCELRFSSKMHLDEDLKAAHNQMMISRSYLSNMQVIDSHIFFVAIPPFPDEVDWKQFIDLVERNETVCRKLVWKPEAKDLAASFAAFIDRSFLAHPWQNISEVSNAPLDQNEELVERVLQAEGLSEKTAAEWVSLAQQDQANPEDLVEKLVAAVRGAP